MRLLQVLVLFLFVIPGTSVTAQVIRDIQGGVQVQQKPQRPKPPGKLSNQDVIDMISLGLSDEVIIDKIHSGGPTDFDTSVEGMRALKAARVSDAVIRAMIQPRPAAAGASSSNSGGDEGGLPQEVGVYVMRDGKSTEVDPEIVGWQTGGVLKSVASLGLNKGHVNGKIMGSNSPLRVTNSAEFLIKTPEGTSVTEYQLLRLDQKSNRREFRAVTGGVIHASGGAERNAIGFDSEKIGPRLWRIRLTHLGRGEYGFLPPGISSASLSASGKMYTFSVGE